MPQYSYSRIGCFETCPRQYKFRYIEKPPIEIPEGVEAFLGKMAHETLEACYQLARYGKPLGEGELLALYERKWTENLSPNVRVVREGLTIDDYFRLGVKALKNYYARYYPFDQEMTLGLERIVTFSLDAPGQYTMKGVIDRITRDSSGRLRIHDYKTSASFPTQEEMDRDAQLALYQIAVEEMWPDNNGVELVWHFLQFDAEFVSHRTPDQLEALRKEYVDKIRRIEAAAELGNFPTQESNLCNWCEYFSLCPAKGGSGGTTREAAPELGHLPKAKVAELVDRFIALDEARKGLEKEHQEIREALIRQGEAGATTLLAGTGRDAVTVSLSTIVKLPTKSADIAAFRRVREAVEAAGLYLPFSALDLGKLQDALESGALPASLKDKLAPFSRTAQQAFVRVKKGRF